MGLETFSTRNENDLKQKEMELIREGFQQVTKTRLDPGEYRITNVVDQDTNEAIYTLEWLDFEYTAASERKE